MPTSLATIVFALGILGLFALDRDRTERTSPALWLTVIWLALGGSRMVSEWMSPGRIMTAAQHIDGSPLDRNILMGLIAIALIVLVERGRTVGLVLRANVPLVLFFLYCAVSTLWSDYPYVAFKRWIKAFGDVTMVLIVLTDPDPSAAVKRLLARLGFLLVPLSILLIKYYPELGRGYENWTWEPTVTGVTTGKNLLGMTCLVCGIGAVWRFFGAFRRDEVVRRDGPLAAQGLLLAMTLWLFWQAQSMTALGCFLLASGVIVVTNRRVVALNPPVVHLLVGAVVSVAIATLFLGVGGGVLEAMGRDPTLTGRTDVWNVALRFRGDPLVGTGFESFWLGERLERIWSFYWWKPNEAHNGYLEVFLNLGLMGVILLAVLLAAGYRNVIRVLRADSDTGTLRLAFFVAVVVYNLTEAAMRMFQPIWVVFLLMIMAAPEHFKSLSRQSVRCTKPKSTIPSNP
jgi:exopolysaccharide production protein ExoQ